MFGFRTPSMGIIDSKRKMLHITRYFTLLSLSVDANLAAHESATASESSKYANAMQRLRVSFLENNSEKVNVPLVSTVAF